jgi:hypothetical protein
MRGTLIPLRSVDLLDGWWLAAEYFTSEISFWFNLFAARVRPTSS